MDEYSISSAPRNFPREGPSLKFIPKRNSISPYISFKFEYFLAVFEKAVKLDYGRSQNQLSESNIVHHTSS